MADTSAIRAFEHAGWERAAHSYEVSFATATRQFIPALLDAAEVGTGRSVLDVACGPGFVAAEAAGRGAAAHGLDFSAAMLRIARALHPGIAFDEGDAEALPYQQLRRGGRQFWHPSCASADRGAAADCSCAARGRTSGVYNLGGAGRERGLEACV
jgi:SAM-dependent methyltransferase